MSKFFGFENVMTIFVYFDKLIILLSCIKVRKKKNSKKNFPYCSALVIKCGDEVK